MSIKGFIVSGVTDRYDYNYLDNKPEVHSIPTGGTAGQVLAKTSGADYAVGWVNQTGGGGGGDITVDDALSTTSENPVQNRVVTTAIDAKYAKPAYGIPSTDMTSAVQASLAKADTALQTAPVTSVNGQTGDVTVPAATDAQVTTAVNTWLGNNIAQETGYALDASLTMSNAAAPADKVGGLKSAIERDGSIISANLMGIDVQQNLYLGAADWSGTWRTSDSVNMGISTVLYNGYPTVYSSQGWRRWFKEIQIEAGKTYTFECMFRHANTGASFLYLKDTSNVPITNPATVSKNFAQFNGTPANTWVKLSVTFTCTASGGITPWAYSGSGAFYIAKYTLVEGDKAFSLSDALETAATKQEISAVGDYQKYTLSLGTSTGEYWNTYIAKNISAGDKIRLVFDYYSGNSALNWVKIAGQKSDQTWDDTVVQISNPEHGSSAEAFAANNYVRLRIQFARATDESNVNGAVLIATNQDLGITNELLSMQSRNVYHVAKDGSGDFTSFVDGINEACKHMDSIVYVGAGTYNLLSELGSSYVSGASSSQMGVVLKNRVHVICSSQTVLAMNYDGSLSNAKEWLSPINTGDYGCTLENATIIDNNVRYSIHDDRGWSGSTPYTNKFINCTLIHKSGKYGDCIGGGLGENGYIEIRGCYLEGDTGVVRLAYYHGNNHTGVTNAKGRIVVADNYFANVGTFQVQKYGDSTEMSTAYVSNNSFGTAPSVTTGQGAQDNMRIIDWNNTVRS